MSCSVFILYASVFCSGAYAFVKEAPSFRRQSNVRLGATAATIVDRNVYNLPLDEAVETWTANLVPESSLQDGGIFLGSKTNGVVADSLTFNFERKVPSLGLELWELAGREDDGVGITIVENLVPDASAAGSGILPGDSIVSVGVITTKTNGNDTTETQETVATECLTYDKTVEALMSLPAFEENVQTYQVTVKRLRRQPRVSVKLQYPDDEPDYSLELFAGQNLRRQLLVRGVKLNDALQKRFDSGGSGDCGAEGSCATCSVEVVRGMELLNPPTRMEAQVFAKEPRLRMSCRTVVGYGDQEGELVVRVNPRQWSK